MTVAADIARLRELLLEATILAGKLGITEAADPGSVVVAAAPAPAARGKRLPIPARLFDVDGEQLTIRQLAERAGCDIEAMRFRLRRHSAAEAIAMGGFAGWRPEGNYVIDGQRFTARQLSEKAGCSLSAMTERLRSMTPADAVAAGAAMRRGRGARIAPPPDPAPPAPPPAIARSVFEVAAAPPPPPQSHSPRVTAPPPKPYVPPTPAPAPKAVAEVVIPPDVKRTVAVTPRDRFAVDEPAQTFSSRRIGEYESTGSAIERASRERQC